MVKMSAGAASSEALTGTGRSASKMAHYMAGELVLAFARKSRVFTTWASPGDAPMFWQHCRWLSPEWVIQERARWKIRYLYNLGPEVTHLHFHRVLLDPQVCHDPVDKTPNTQGHDYKDRITGVILESGRTWI